MAKHRIFTTSFASVYPAYVAKAEKKGRTKAEVDQIITWLTGYRQVELEAQLRKGKHAHAWTAMKTMPTTHMLPMQLAAGMKGCGGCRHSARGPRQDGWSPFSS